MEPWIKDKTYGQRQVAMGCPSDAPVPKKLPLSFSGVKIRAFLLRPRPRGCSGRRSPLALPLWADAVSRAI